MATQFPPQLVESIYVKSSLNTPPRVHLNVPHPDTIYQGPIYPVVHPDFQTPYLSRFHEQNLQLDREFQNLRLECENDHRNKVENLLRQTAEINTFNNSLEQEIRALSEAINREKLNQSNSIKEKDNQRNLSDKVSFSKIEKIKTESLQKMDQLQFQILTIKEKLHHASSQSEEFRRKASEFESRSLLLTRNETRLRDYEEKIAHLTHELHGKQNEIDNLRTQIANNANVHSNTVFVLEKEVINVRDMDAVQLRENGEMLNDQSKLEMEKYNLHESEKVLRAQEIELLAKVEAIQNEILQIENQKNEEIFLREKEYENQKNILERTHAIEVDRLTSQLLKLESELNEKIAKFEQIRADNANLQRELAHARGTEHHAQHEAIVWRERANSSEIEKERQSRFHRHVRETEVKNTILSHSHEKLHLEGHIRNLSNQALRKENELIHVKTTLNHSQLQKSQLEATNTALQSHINNTVERLNRSVDEFVGEVRHRDMVHESSLERLIASQNIQKAQLEDQIRALRSLVEGKKRELHDANNKSTLITRDIVVASQRKSEAENARNFWNTTAVVTENVKNSEIRNVENARITQINSMRNSHVVDMSHRTRDNVQLSNVLNVKDFEQRQLSNDNVNLNNDFRHASNEQIRNSQEALYWRDQAAIAERERYETNLRNENLRRQALINTDHHHSIEKSQLINEASHVHNVAVSKAVETEQLKSTINNVVRARSPVLYTPSRIPTAPFRSPVAVAHPRFFF